jgi:antitoxin MazE
MVTKVQTWGNSQGLRLSKQVLDEAHISVGDEVDLTVHDGVIVIAPARRVRGRCNLKDLVDGMPPDYQPSELDWGAPLGREVW